VEPAEQPLYRPLTNFDGNTCVVGTTRSGKGVLLTHFAYQAIARGDVVVVIDPKNSHRLRAAVERACADAGRPAPLHFHPAFPDRGIRLDPLYSWQRPTELASRIESVMPPDTSGAFKAFGWLALAVVVEACVAVEDRPNLLKLTQYIEGGIEPILEASLERHFVASAPVGWRDSIHAYMRHAQALKRRPSEDASDRLMAFVFYYKREIARYHRSQSIDSQIKVFEHNREHYAKITANLLPILKQLTSGPLGRSLSPDPYDANDRRPIMNLQKVADGGHVLYLSLDSLPEPITGSAIGAITLADMAALAGMRYNSGKYGTPITLIVDEMAEVVNRPLIQILNKGAESGVTCTCAMQTMSDLADRLGSPDAARVVVGNLNNLFVLRSKCQFTQEFATETFGRTYIHNVDETIATGQDQKPGDFSASYARRRTATLEEVVPAFALGKLPNCQFFASVSGGRLLKGRVPILLTDEG
jgi:conjugal transfer pilus assembly protein TraD